MLSKCYCLFGLFLYSQFVYADALSSSAPQTLAQGNNPAWEHVTIKSRAKHGPRNGQCAEYINIYGNRDWENEKEQLNTLLKNHAGCKELTIYKIIKNVSNGRVDSNGFREGVNIGTKLTEQITLKDVKIKVFTTIINSEISADRFFESVNTGISIEGRGSKIHDSELENKQIIENSVIGR